MTGYLLRHACAGRKGDWDGDDEDRPLDAAGRAQAAALVDAFGSCGGPAALEPGRRCVETLEPLARARKLSIESTSELTTRASIDDLVSRMTESAFDGTVLCTHGEPWRPCWTGCVRTVCGRPTRGQPTTSSC